MYKGAPPKLWHSPTSATGLSLCPLPSPWMESSGLVHDLPQVQCPDTEPEGELWCPGHTHCRPNSSWHNPLTARRLSRSGPSVHLRVGDLVWEVEEVTRGSPGVSFVKKCPPPFLHTSSGNVACAAPVLSLRKGKDSSWN